MQEVHEINFLVKHGASQHGSLDPGEHFHDSFMRPEDETEENHSGSENKRNSSTVGTYSCDICLSRFSTKQYLIIHKRKHSGEKPYKCEMCPASFANKQVLDTHRNIHKDVDDKKYRCSVCHAGFSQHRTLAVHERLHVEDINHHAIKPEALIQTPNKRDGPAIKSKVKEYKQEALASLHQVKLETALMPSPQPKQEGAATPGSDKKKGQKFYDCDICESRFSTKQYLKIHKRKHSGEKPYHCDICPFKASERGVLHTHKLIHIPSDEKKYHCYICNAGFKKQCALVVHERVHFEDSFEEKCRRSDLKPFKCDHCSRTFSHERKKLVHERLLHSKEMIV